MELGRLDFTGSETGRPYAEGSLRAGGVNNDYQNNDLRDELGRRAEYSASSAYVGAHLGGGYVLNLGEAASLDLYGKYFWTRQGGDSVTLPTGDPVNFEAANSHRLRAGARLAFSASETISPYVGAAYEHELDGKAKASTYGYAIDAPSIRGGTGIGELGLNLRPAEGSPFSLDLGVQGYVGKREGVTGSLQFKFEF